MLSPPICHISDTHIKGRAWDNADVEQKLMLIRSKLPDNGTLVCTGDLVQGGKRRQFAQMYELFKPFAGNLVLAPGNHDYGSFGIFNSFISRWRWGRVCSKLNTISGEHRGYYFEVLDTCFAWWSLFKLARGRVTKWMRNNIKKTRENTKLPILICMHHDPKNEKPELLLEGADEFNEVVQGRALAVLYGHSHRKAILNAEHPYLPLYHSADNLRDNDWRYEDSLV